jgi:hypothetical protein
MKKTTILIFAVLFTAIFNQSFGRNVHDSSTNAEAFVITTLVINANVTVILVNNDDASLEATGNKAFRKLVRLWKSGDTLTIHSTQKNAFYEGTVYVPASQLRQIHVNSNASVRSLFALQIPNLNVVINGECNVSVSNIGEVNVTGTDNFSIEENRMSRPLPSSFRRKKG